MWAFCGECFCRAVKNAFNVSIGIFVGKKIKKLFFVIIFQHWANFSAFWQIFLAELSKLHSRFPEDCSEEHHFLWQKGFSVNQFQTWSESVSRFFGKFKTAYHVFRGSLWANIFQKIFSNHLLFDIGAIIFPAFFNNLKARVSELRFTCPYGLFEEKCTLKKCFFFFGHWATEDWKFVEKIQQRFTCHVGFFEATSFCNKKLMFLDILWYWGKRVRNLAKTLQRGCQNCIFSVLRSFWG